MSTTHLARNSVAPEVLVSRMYKLKGQAQVIVHVIPSNGSLPTNDHVLVRVAYAPLSGRGSRKNVGDEIVTTWGRLLPTIAPRDAAKGEG